MIDRGTENVYNSLECYPDFITTHSHMVNDMVIVHLTILKPEVDVIARQICQFRWKFWNIC